MGTHSILAAVIPVLLATSVLAQTAAVRFVPFSDVQPILAALRPELLPAELREPAATAAIWTDWASARDAAIRSRLKAGDDDSVVNFLLFGTTFTRAARATERDLLNLPPNPAAWPANIRQRIDDLAAAIGSPNPTERVAFVRDTIGPRASAARAYLQEALARAGREAATYARTIEAARTFADTATMAQQSVTAFRDRGLSSDTSIFDNLAIDQALNALKANGLLDAGSVRRVAIVGPGLDFTDKHDGYDFYPPQSIQPFAVADSLVRSGLSARTNLQIATFDLSPRINRHLEAAVSRARAGEPYGLVLPRNLELPWTQDLVSYWSRFGDQIGTVRNDVAVPTDVGRVAVRGISVRPDVVASLTPRDVNIILQRLGDQQFDVIVATNVLVYYGVFEQALASANIASMLRPGGFLLCNTGLLLVPSSPLALAGYSDVIYMNVPGVGETGDRLYWYRRS